MEEIEPTKVALDSRLVSASKLRCRAFRVWPELLSFGKSLGAHPTTIRGHQARLSLLEQY
jgi:hypothetical protein